jgi:transposase
VTSTAALSADVKNYIIHLEKKNKELTDNIINYEEKVKELESRNSCLEQQNVHLEQQNLTLEQKLKLALWRQFAKASERIIIPGQMLLFDSGESAAKEEKPAEKTTVKEHEREKRGRKRLDARIPRVEEIIDLADDEKTCGCGAELKMFSEEVREYLTIIPEQVYVRKRIIRQYSCPKCGGSGDEEHPAVRTGKIPKTILPGSIATPELLSTVFIRKYCDYVPYYRQEAAFSRIGADISRQNMGNWQMGITEKTRPLLALIKEHVTSGEVVQMDETTMHVMDEPGRNNAQKSYMWLARGGPPDKKALWYEYRQTRQKEHISEILGGFQGWLQSDGYKSYASAVKKDLSGIKHCGCLAHVRRKFVEAQQVSNGAMAIEALERIKRIYETEKVLRIKKEKNKKYTDEDFTEERKEQSVPLYEAFHDWLVTNETKVPDQSKIGEAIRYALGQWDTLQTYLDVAELTPDNNACERAIRPFVMGRKNWVMSGSPAGAKSSCEMYTLIETAKANGWNPYEYLTKIFTLAADMDETDDWSELLPWILTA